MKPKRGLLSFFLVFVVALILSSQTQAQQDAHSPITLEALERPSSQMGAGTEMRASLVIATTQQRPFSSLAINLRLSRMESNLSVLFVEKHLTPEFSMERDGLMNYSLSEQIPSSLPSGNYLLELILKQTGGLPLDSIRKNITINNPHGGAYLKIVNPKYGQAGRFYDATSEFFHMGTGNLHFTVRNPGQVERTAIPIFSLAPATADDRPGSHEFIGEGITLAPNEERTVSLPLEDLPEYGKYKGLLQLYNQDEEPVSNLLAVVLMRGDTHVEIWDVFVDDDSYQQGDNATVLLNAMAVTQVDSPDPINITVRLLKGSKTVGSAYQTLWPTSITANYTPYRPLLLLAGVEEEVNHPQIEITAHRDGQVLFHDRVARTPLRSEPPYIMLTASLVTLSVMLTTLVIYTMLRRKLAW